MLETIVIYVFSVFFNLGFTCAPVLLVQTVAWVLHAKDAHIEIVGDRIHLVLRDVDVFGVAVEIEHQFW